MIKMPDVHANVALVLLEEERQARIRSIAMSAVAAALHEVAQAERQWRGEPATQD
jgi:hypothetical protein